MRKILISLMTVVLVVGLVGGGAFAYFSDTETSGQNTFTAGTLDLKVDGNDNPNIVHIEVSNIAPGWHEGYKWTLKNVGSIPGKVSVEFSPITNLEGAVTEPELVAEAQDYWGYPLGRAEGELGEYLSTTGGYYYPLWSWHEFITSRNTGPPVPPRGITTLGLDALGGNTYATGVTLAPGEEMGFGLDLFLRSDLRAWDGCAGHDWIDDNIIQGDSVVFDIIFHLDQVP